MITEEDLLAAGFRPAVPFACIELAQDSLTAAIHAHLDWVRANGGNIQNLPPLPSLPFVGTPDPSNPFHPVVQSMKPRRAVLTVDEVVKGFNAVSFAMRKHGTVMNAHFTFAWGLMGIRDHAEATRVFTAFNQEAAKWLAVGSPSMIKFRRRMTKRAEVGGTEHMYFYVHENARDRGFHTHMLAFIPPTKAALFKAWARGCLHRLSGYKGMHEDALHITVDNSRIESQRVAWCWARFRYMTKTLEPTWHVRGDKGEWLEGRAIFRPDRPFVEAAPVHCAQVTSGSRNIWTKAQADAGFVSRYRVTGELDRLYDGSELHERRREIERAEDEARIVDLTRTLNL
ncbi:MAG: hypothetical protein J0I54_15995 [Bosea sp.]|uniref:hypothetical protein n=1 Tax=unclassified Bosea (in: a-proteobacteria) TaxID=2653178 RepID=UPI000963AA8F|nr:MULTISPECIES: hypothetical protein [unclassified Bosea (in: a-proteobacteria)]MBN9458135.1 hypothetical protein [Bosea sp. (in: a-proteobacteria)]OJV10631.1 MAG: hypothetical protein BGO20_07895 [Bosea sp. 67-29]